MILKLGLVVEGIYVTFWAVTTVDSMAEAVIVLAAVVTALTILGRAARSTARYLRKLSHGYSILLEAQERLGSVEQRLGNVERALDVISDAERGRIVSALERADTPGRRAGDIVPGIRD